MALLDDKLDPRRVGSGPIGGQSLSYKDLSRVSFGRIGDQPIPNAAFGDLANGRPRGEALLDDESSPRRSAGKIGGPPTVRSFPDIPSGQPILSADPDSQLMGNTRNVLQQGSADIRNAFKQGGLGPAIGMFGRVAVAGPLAVLHDLTPNTAGAGDGLATFLTGKVPDSAARQKQIDTPEAPTVAPTGSAPAHSAADKAPARGPSVPSRPVPGTNGVSRIDLAGKAPLFTNLDPETAVSQMSGNPVGFIPAGVSPFGGGSTGGELSAALQAAAARGDWDAVRQHYQRAGGTWQGKTSDQEVAGGVNVLEWDKLVDEDKIRDARGKLLDALTNVQPGRNGLSKNQATLLMQLLGDNQRGSQAQAELAMRAKQQADTLGIQQGNLAVAQQQAGTHSLTSLLQAALAGNQLEDSKELRALRQQFQAAKTPEESAALAKKILVLQGKDPRQGHDEMLKARAALFGDAVKGASSGMMTGPDGKALTLDQLLAQGQQFMTGGPAPAADAPAGAAEIKGLFDAGKITREQALAELNKLGMK